MNEYYAMFATRNGNTFSYTIQYRFNEQSNVRARQVFNAWLEKISPEARGDYSLVTGV